MVGLGPNILVDCHTPLGLPNFAPYAFIFSQKRVFGPIWSMTKLTKCEYGSCGAVYMQENRSYGTHPTMSQHPRGTLDAITCHIGASTHAHSTPFARRATQIDQIQRRMAAVRLLHAREPLICYPAMGKHPRGPWAPLHATCWREPCALYLVHAPRDANRPNAYQMQ